MLNLATLLLLAAVPGSSIAIDPLGRGTWVVDPDRDEVALVAEGKKPKVQRLTVGRWPQQLIVDATGRVFVTCRQSGQLDIIEPDLRIHSLAVGAEPASLTLEPNEGRLYVGLITARAVAVVDTAKLSVVRTVPLTVEPTSIALTATELAVLPRRGEHVTFVSRKDWSSREVTLEEDRRRAWHGVALVAVNDAVLVIHAAVDTGLEKPVSSGGYGGAVSQPIELVASIIRDDVAIRPPAFSMGRALHVADVSGAIYGSDGLLVLTGRGDGRVSGARLDPVTLALSGSFMIDLQIGVSGVARHPNGSLRISSKFGEEVVVLEPKLAKVTAPDLAGWSLGRRFAVPDVEEPFVVRARIPLGAKPLPGKLELGRQLFHTANSGSLSGRSNLSCATCHPDGREDGLVWRLEGSRRQTPFLAARLEGTAPFNWQGKRRRWSGMSPIRSGAWAARASAENRGKRWSSTCSAVCASRRCPHPRTRSWSRAAPSCSAMIASAARRATSTR